MQTRTSASAVATEPAPCPLRGKVALITGGARGIGRATALKLAAAGETPDLDAASLAALPQDPYAHFIAPSAGSSYYAYEGSMTTPDCQSAVQWLVLSRPLTVSAATLAAFIASVGPGRTDGVPSQAVACAMPGHAFCTYRSAQPLNNRTITTGTLASAMRTVQS